MLFSKALVLLTAAMSASAISTQHMARNMYHRRHTVIARSAVPETTAVTPTVVPKKRVVKRCKSKSPTSSTLVSSSVATPSSSAVVSSSAEAQPTSAPVNVGGDVPTFSSSVAPSTSAVASSAPAPESSSAAPSTSDAAPTTSKADPTTSKAAATTEASPTTSATPTTTKVTSTTSSTAAAATSTSDSDLLTATHSGDGTWYATGLGACGITNNDNQKIAAVSKLLFDTFPGYTGANPNNNPICGKTATATWGGKSVTVTLTDRCVACDMFSLDFSPAAFSELADQSVGRLTGMTWKFD